MKINFKFRNHFLMLFLSVFLSACLTNVEEPIDNEEVDVCETVTYALSVKPIIDNSCTQCHSSNGGQFPNLDSYNALSSNASSVLLEVESRRMPIGSSLTTAEIAIIKCWVEKGALNN
ncbi:MAG: cytochrome c [Polaribacter sp.]|nr:cytochrome c [Polaribacter sp.]